MLARVVGLALSFIVAGAGHAARAADAAGASKGAETATQGTGSPPTSPPPTAAAEVANITTEVYFDTRSATLDARGRAVLDQWLQAIRGVTPSFILSIGHADPGEVPGALKAVKLSEARARAVRAYLASRGGFQPGQINVEGKGDTQPVSTTSEAAERARNRRVDVGMVGRRG